MLPGLHGGAPGSGMRTPEGIRAAVEGTKRYWEAYRLAKALAESGGA